VHNPQYFNVFVSDPVAEAVAKNEACAHAMFIHSIGFRTKLGRIQSGPQAREHLIKRNEFPTIDLINANQNCGIESGVHRFSGGFKRFCTFYHRTLFPCFLGKNIHNDRIKALAFSISSISCFNAF
jgi:hypothetical protein